MSRGVASSPGAQQGDEEEEEDAHEDPSQHQNPPGERNQRSSDELVGAEKWEWWGWGAGRQVRTSRKCSCR